MHDAPAIMGEDDEDEQHPERHRGHGEKVNGNQVSNVVVQKGPPGLGRRVFAAEHILGDRGLRYLDAELEQFAVNSWRSPKWIGSRHLADEFPDIWGNRRSPLSLSTACPGPVQPETLSVPSDDGVGLHHDQATGPVLPEPGQQHPQESVALLQIGTLDTALQNGDLMAQREVLKGQASAGRQGGN